jgi:LuxR family maltose regulon positive regulatory protein
VLGLLGGSLSLREIGRELYVSQNTIKTHIRAIYRKLGVSTRHDAIAAGHDIADSPGNSGPFTREQRPGVTGG